MAGQGSALRKINTRVKQLAKKHPTAKRRTLQKQAGAEYRAGKLGAVKKQTVTKKRVVTTVKKKIGATSTISHHLGKAREMLKEKLGWYLATAVTAKTKKQKRAVLKKAAEVRTQLRRIM